MSHSRQKLDLTGLRFGMLTVVAPAENIGSRTAWLCKCDCGRERVVKTVFLRNGRTKNCGCVIGCPPLPDGQSYPPGEVGRAALTYIDGTCVEMLAAKTVRRNNTSGVPGVAWRASKRRWCASICFKGKRYNLGSYGKFEDAVEARREAEARLHDSFLREYEQKAAWEKQAAL